MMINKDDTSFAVTRIAFLVGFFFILFLIVKLTFDPLKLNLPLFIGVWGASSFAGYAFILLSRKSSHPDKWLLVAGACLMGSAIYFIAYLSNLDKSGVSLLEFSTLSNLVILLSGSVGANALYAALSKGRAE